MYIQLGWAACVLNGERGRGRCQIPLAVAYLPWKQKIRHFKIRRVIFLSFNSCWKLRVRPSIHIRWSARLTEIIRFSHCSSYVYGHLMCNFRSFFFWHFSPVFPSASFIFNFQLSLSQWVETNCYNISHTWYTYSRGDPASLYGSALETLQSSVILVEL